MTTQYEQGDINLLTSSQIIFGQTLTQLQARGSDTNPSIAFGGLAWSASGEGLIFVDTISSGSSTWAAAATETFTYRGTSVSSAQRYLAWFGSDAENTVFTNIVQQLALGYPLRIEEVFYRCSSAPGNTTISVHKNGNVTAEASNTQDPGGTFVGVTVSTSVDFSTTDYSTIGILAPGGPGDVTGHVITRKLFT